MAYPVSGYSLQGSTLNPQQPKGVVFGPAYQGSRAPVQGPTYNPQQGAVSPQKIAPQTPVSVPRYTTQNYLDNFGQQAALSGKWFNNQGLNETALANYYAQSNTPIDQAWADVQSKHGNYIQQGGQNSILGSIGASDGGGGGTAGGSGGGGGGSANGAQMVSIGGQLVPYGSDAWRQLTQGQNDAAYKAQQQASAYSQTFNGQNYGDPGAYSNAVRDYNQSQYNTFHPGFNQTFNGATYTDPQSFENAYLAYQKQQNDSQRGLLEGTYNAGLNSFLGRQQGIDQATQNLGNQRTDLATNYQNTLKNLGLGRDQALNSQAGFFSYVSPNASQSAEQTMAQRTQDQYKSDVSSTDLQNTRNNTSIDQALANNQLNSQSLSTDKSNFLANYSNQVGQLENAFKGQQDEAANYVQQYGQKQSQDLAAFQNAQQQLSDQGSQQASSIYRQNNLNNFNFQNTQQSVQDQANTYNAQLQASLAAANARQYASSSAATENFDPIGALQKYREYALNAEASGFQPQQIAGNIQAALKKSGASGNQVSAILNSLYGGAPASAIPF